MTLALYVGGQNWSRGALIEPFQRLGLGRFPRLGAVLIPSQLSQFESRTVLISRLVLSDLSTMWPEIPLIKSLLTIHGRGSPT